jgi:predicted DsbA family dithiol-disulfide isomerase
VANLKKYATQMGLDTASFSTCLDSGRSAAKLRTDLEEGKTYRIQGVPAVVINNKLAAEGLASVGVYQSIIDAELNK